MTTKLWTWMVLFVVLEQTLAERHNHLAKWSVEQSKWLARTGPATTLKLFQKIGYNASHLHQVFSPLALKLSLLSLASLSNPSQEAAINRFLFDQPVLKSMLTQSFKPAEEPEKPVPANSSTSTPCLYGMDHPHFEAPPAGSQASPSLSPSSRKLEIGGFCDELNYFASRLCEAYARATPPLGPTELSRGQKIALCHAFEVRDFAECVMTFIGDPKDFCTDSVHRYIAQYNANYSNADIGWQEVRQFHRTEEKSSFIHRVVLASLGGDHATTTPGGDGGKLWSRALEWFQMKHFELPKQLDQWEGFKRDHLPNELYEHDQLNPSKATFLNLIHFDLKLNRTFYPLQDRTNFYSPNGSVHQVDTLCSTLAHFPIVLHRDAETGSKYHTLIRIPYEDPKYSMVLLMPDQHSGIAEMMSTLKPAQLDYYFKRLLIDQEDGQKPKVVLTLPRFNISGSMNFEPLLSRDLATPTLNLTRVSPDLHLPVNVQQYIAVSNLGVREEEKLVLEARYQFEPADVNINDILPVNRPFVYLILGKYVDLHHKPAFEIVLAGYYNGPV